MAIKEARKISGMNEDAMARRLKKIIDARDEFMKNIDEHHVKLQNGNNKTGDDCPTVSLAPIIDCKNCSGCRRECYDLRNDLRFPNVINDRAKNSAIHKADPKRYWNEIEEQINTLDVTELRVNVGGDLNYDDFVEIYTICINRPQTDILFFTKNDDDINAFLDKYDRPNNMKPILSMWEGMDIKNPHNLPCAHVLYADGRTTAPEYGAYYCGGNCSECHRKKEGCWTLQPGEHVIFRAH